MKKTIFFCLFLVGLKSYSTLLNELEPLQGSWRRPCAQGSFQSQNFSGSQSLSEDFFFQDGACEKPLLTFLNKGNIKIENNQIDFEFEEVQLNLHTKALVKDYNARAVCDHEDWKIDEPKSITGLRCALFQKDSLVQIPKQKEFRYGIWKKEGTQLIFGKLTRSENGSTPLKRPTTWDPRPYEFWNR